MFARVATFEDADASRLDEMVEGVRRQIESETTPEGLEGELLLGQGWNIGSHWNPRKRLRAVSWAYVPRRRMRPVGPRTGERYNRLARGAVKAYPPTIVPRLRTPASRCAVR